MSFNENPLVWFLVLSIIGYFSVTTNNFEFFVVVAVAVLVAKIVEVIHMVKK